MDKVVLRHKKTKKEFTMDPETWRKQKSKFPMFEEVKVIVTPPEVLELQKQILESLKK